MPSSLQVALLVALILTAAKGTGALSKRLGQPAVFGELLIGVLLGPTLLDVLHWPVFSEPEYLGGLVRDLGELGAIILMLLAGLETDLAAMRKVGTAAFFGATGGVALPFLAGTGIGLAFGFPAYESIYIGTVLTATSVSISAQTLLELGHLRSREGTTILGAAVIDDIMGIVLLSVVVALHQASGGGEGASSPIWLIIARMALFFAGAVALGRWLVPALLRWARTWPGTEPLLAAAIVLGLLFAVAAQKIGGVAAITGSYTLGVLLGLERELKHAVEEKLATLAYAFFVPIFFVSIGLQADLARAVDGSGLAFTALVVAGAILTKILGASLGVRPFGFRWPEALRVGIGMVSRGEVALIVAGIGLQTGVMSEPVFSVMVVMTLVTTLLTPPLLRWSFGRATPPGQQAVAARRVIGSPSGATR